MTIHTEHSADQQSSVVYLLSYIVDLFWSGSIDYFPSELSAVHTGDSGGMHRGGYLRHKISSSIEERRARRRRADSDGREDGADSLASAAGASHSSSFTGDTARFSGLLRQTSEHDFLVVEEDNKPRSRSMGFRSPGNRQAARDFDEDEDDPTEGHHRLDQGAQNRQGSEEPISDLDLEKLDVPDEEEDLCSKSSSAPKEKEAKQKDKIWEVKNAGVYEQQLELLQDQLTSALIENQSLKSEYMEKS